MAMLNVLRPPPAAAAWVEGAIAVRFAPGQHITRFPAMPNAMLAVRLWPHGAAAAPLCGPVRFHTLHTQPVVHHHAGAVGALGLIVRPLAAATLLGRMGGPIVNGELPWAELAGASEAARLDDALALARSPRARLQALLASLVRTMRQGQPQPANVTSKWIDALGVHGAQAAEHLGLGPRQLERRCQALLGLSPKVFQSLVRFQRVLAVSTVGSQTLADVAASAGYFDQSHLGREARRFAGHTLRDLRESAQADSPWWALAAGRQVAGLGDRRSAR